MNDFPPGNPPVVCRNAAAVFFQNGEPSACATDDVLVSDLLEVPGHAVLQIKSPEIAEDKPEAVVIRIPSALSGRCAIKFPSGIEGRT